MATIENWNPFGVALDITATGSSVTRTSATQFTVKVSASWETYYDGAATKYGMKVVSGDKTIYIPKFTGDSASSGSGSLTGTYSISGNGSQTKTISVIFTNYDDLDNSASKTVTFNVTVPAWTSYTVSYNANGGSGAPSSQTKWKDQTLTLSSTKPTRTGYTFVGWALTQTDANNGTWYYKAGSTCGKNENLTLYAVWDVNSYTYNIVYKSSSGTQLGTATVSKDYGTTNTVSPKSFTGYTSPSSQSVKWDSTSAKTITFTYTPISYNVTINCNGGSGVSSRTYTIETATFSLGTPTRTGYTFDGWTGSNGTTAQKTVSISKGSTGAKSYTAQWSENVLTINYYSNYATRAFDGALNTVGADKNVLVHTGQAYYDNDYSANGLPNYSSSGGAVYMERIGYTPTGYWQTSDGKSVHENDKSFTTGQSLAQALGKDISKSSTSVTVYAQWQKNTYTFLYNSNGGSGSMNPQTVQWQDAFTLSNNIFKREGYKFIGWNVCRSDNTWYVTGQGWLTEDEIVANGYQKRIYENQTQLTFSDIWVRGNEYALSQYTLYAIWEISGVVYISNGTIFEPYLAYIDNGSAWDLYLAYIDDGAEWKIIS